MSKILAISIGRDSDMFVLCSGGSIYGHVSEYIVPCDFTNTTKSGREIELALWRPHFKEARFVLCNPDGSEMEEL